MYKWVNSCVLYIYFRYLAICLPLDFKISKRGCKITIISIWIAAFAVLIPWAVFYKLSLWQPPTGNPMILCFEDWPHDGDQKHYFLGAIFLCCYSVPLVLIVVCYFLIGLRVWRRRVPGVKNPSLEIVHKSKVNAVKMLAVVVVLFAFSWLPLYALRLKAMFGKPSSKELQTILQDIINPIAQWLGSSNSGMNPVIYFFFSKRYRRGFKETIHCCDSGKKRLQNRNSLFHQMSTQSYANGASGKPRLTYIFKTSPEKSNSTSTTQV